MAKTDEGRTVKESARDRKSRERDELIAEVQTARQRLEQVAGNFPHVNKGGPASIELERAAREFARLAQELDDAPELEADKDDRDAEERALDAENALNANVNSLRDDENRRRPGLNDFNTERDAATDEVRDAKRDRNDKVNADDAAAHERQDRLDTQETQQATTRRRRDGGTDTAEPADTGDALGAPAADAARG